MTFSRLMQVGGFLFPALLGQKQATNHFRVSPVSVKICPELSSQYRKAIEKWVLWAEKAIKPRSTLVRSIFARRVRGLPGKNVGGQQSEVR